MITIKESVKQYKRKGVVISEIPQVEMRHKGRRMSVLSNAHVEMSIDQNIVSIVTSRGYVVYAMPYYMVEYQHA